MQEPRYANYKQPTIEAIQIGEFSFSNINEAKHRLKIIKQTFTISRKADREDDMSTIMWISGFEVTDEERQKGYKGNFGKITVEALPNGRYTLKLVKIIEDLRHHPAKKKMNMPHPDWGHPILRSIKKKIKYLSEKDAWLDLKKLHEEYPNTTIPGPNKLFIQVFSKQYGPTPIKKFILEIQADGDVFIISIKENPTQGRLPRHKVDEVLDTLEDYLLF